MPAGTHAAVCRRVYDPAMSRARKAADDSASCQAVRDAIEQGAGTWREVAALTGLSHEWARQLGMRMDVRPVKLRRRSKRAPRPPWNSPHIVERFWEQVEVMVRSFRVRRADAVLDVARENQCRGLWRSVSGSVPRERAPLFLSTPPRQEAVVDRRSPLSFVLAGLPWRPVLSSSVVHEPRALRGRNTHRKLAPGARQ